MTVFLYTATGADGTNGAGRIDAASLEAARFRLEQQGFGEIVFHTDEYTNQLNRAHGFGRAAEEVSAEQELKNRRSSSRGLGFIIECYRGNWIVWVPPLLWAIWNVLMGTPYTLRDWLSFLLAPLALVFPVWAAVPARAYSALLDATAWARWSEVRQRVGFFRRWGKYFPVSIPPLELDVREACAIAGQGDLQGALRRVESYATTVQPAAVYHGRLSSIYAAARDWQGSARCQAEALHLSDNGTVETIDYATTLVWRLRDADGAERLLDGIAGKELTALAQAFVDYARGLIALERGQAAAANDALRRAGAFEAQYDNPLMAGLADYITAHLAIATAQLGDKPTARKMLRASLPRLTAFKDLDLARRCAAAVA